MLAVITHESITLTDVLILMGVAGYLIERTIDAKGWSRSSKTLRRENEDLVRRNDELEHQVEILTRDLHELREEVRQLRLQDQRAVLDAFKVHEINAVKRTEETHRVLDKVTMQLTRIANVLEQSSPT